MTAGWLDLVFTKHLTRKPARAARHGSLASVTVGPGLGSGEIFIFATGPGRGLGISLATQAQAGPVGRRLGA